jgi:hypothetical protein
MFRPDARTGAIKDRKRYKRTLSQDHAHLSVVRRYCFERLLTIDGATVAATLVAFRCTGNGHIFFVREADVGASDSIVAKASTKRLKRQRVPTSSAA